MKKKIAILNKTESSNNDDSIINTENKELDKIIEVEK
jgi:hypothetical protein